MLSSKKKTNRRNLANDIINVVVVPHIITFIQAAVKAKRTQPLIKKVPDENGSKKTHLL